MRLHMKNKIRRPSVMRQRKQFFISLTVVFVVFLVLIYFGVSRYYHNHFYSQTFINGIDCSNLTVEEAREAISYEVHTYVLELHGRNDITERISAADIGLDVNFDVDLEELMKGQSPYKWILHSWTDNKLENPVELTYDEEKLDQAIKRLEFLDESKVIKPVNAYISEYRETGFEVVKEELGTQVLRDKLIDEIKKAIISLDKSLDLEEKECYVNPTIYSDNEQLKAAVEQANFYASTKLTYEFGDVTEILDGSVIGPALSITEDYQVTIDEAKIREFVDYIGKYYNSFGRKRTFQTSYGKTVTVSGGDYGWWLNRDKEQEEIIEAIKNGEQKVKEPVYFQKAAQYGDDDIGNTYVEINLSAQHLFFYKDGKLVVESDFVSGKVSTGHATPVGTYSITYKKTDATLEGEDYSTPVKYWMPFNRHIGMHDASWRSKFGGDIFINKGSHGCINLPESVAKTIFATISKGDPVICYELEGTEGYSQADYDKAVQKAQKAEAAQTNN